MTDGATVAITAPGAAALGEALEALGFGVNYVADERTADVVAAAAGRGAEVLTFPTDCDERTARAFAEGVLAGARPTLVASVERCGASQRTRQYLSCRGEDLGAYTARCDAIFEAVAAQRRAGERPEDGTLLLAVGDGGNECGMGGVGDAARALGAAARGGKV